MANNGARLGQVWAEKNSPHRVGEVVHQLMDGGASLKITNSDAQPGDRTTIPVPHRFLIQNWALRTEAPGGPVRTITLSLARDVTDKLCGCCSLITGTEQGPDICAAFGVPLEFDDEVGHSRLDQCVIAEMVTP